MEQSVPIVTVMQTFGDSPMADQFKGKEGLVMHAQLRLGDKVLMASDSAGFSEWLPPNGITLQTAFETMEEAKRVFEALSEGGEVTMPFEATFWAKGFGMLRDKFGMPWMVNCEG